MLEDYCGVPGLGYCPNFLEPDRIGQLVECLSHLEWNPVIRRSGVVKREEIWAGIHSDPRSRRVTVEPPPPRLVVDVGHSIERFLGLLQPFDSYLMNRYPVGGSISPHTDDARYGAPIVGLSLKGECVLVLMQSPEHRTECPIEAGSLFVLDGPARWNYQHAVSDLTAARLSVTFRRYENPAAS